MEQAELGRSGPRLDLIALNEALERLAVEAPEKAEIVQLKYFAGLTHDEIAELLGVAPITVKRHWRFARAWLLRQMEEDRDGSEG